MHEHIFSLTDDDFELMKEGHTLKCECNNDKCHLEVAVKYVKDTDERAVQIL